MIQDSYVVFINETREVMKAGNQCFYSYGSLSNQFLLVVYGFCFANNAYDSYKFNVRMKIDPQHGPFTPENMIAPPDQETKIQQIRLKHNQLNFILLTYLRNIKKTSFFGKTSQYSKKVPVSKCFDLQFDLTCMILYESLINFIL
jgi:hypothetical protein